MIIQRGRRAGFTLLEVILASMISILLLVALYTALELQFRMAQTGREEVEKATLTRAIFGRLTRDLVPSLAPITVVPQPSASSSSSSGSTTGSSASSTTSATSTTSSTTTSTTSAASSGGTVPIPLAAGVVGDSTSLTIYTSRVFGPNDVDPNILSDGMSQYSDQRRISYWLASTGTGLCREEEKFLFSDDLSDITTPDYSNEPSYVIAPEVTQVQFEYYDGTNWNDTWDGSTLADDGVTPIGPPKAIRVHVWIQPTTKGADPKEYIKSIALPTSPAPPLDNQEVGGSTTTTTGNTTPGTTYP